MTTGSCHGGLADQALNVRIQKPVHNKTSSTLLSFFQRSLLLRQSRSALLLRIFSSFLLQDLLLHPSDPHHWFTGMPLLHIRAHVLEVMNLMKILSVDSCVRRKSCDGSTTSLIARSIVHFHVSRHSLRLDLSQPLECMPCLQSSARGFRRWYALNELIISEAKSNITEDSRQLCQRIDDFLLFIISVAATKASDYFQRLTTQAAAQTCSRLPTRNFANEYTIKRESTKHRRIITWVNVENANTVVDGSEPACQG
ncbi:hypothetical protein T02_2265 [Trichinella nativa]|uniref:Uncharacterized protein n=1 Tax=Trichinella nativa TaxID=6335 RepID=A0A0V1KTA7_9BILA|nr:hypothetical protein T02_2265 [Trichinella nativa]